jgi:(+)-pinoresinol hydroxylase
MKTMRLLAAALLCTATSALAAAPDAAKIYQQWCAACHAPGITHPGTHALIAKYAGRKSGVITEWTDLTPDYVRVLVRTGISVMPHFRKTEISDAELDALAIWLARKR